MLRFFAHRRLTTIHITGLLLDSKPETEVATEKHCGSAYIRMSLLVWHSRNSKGASRAQYFPASACVGRVLTCVVVFGAVA